MEMKCLPVTVIVKAVIAAESYQPGGTQTQGEEQLRRSIPPQFSCTQAGPFRGYIILDAL